jgi:ABC-type antimicrobial peptide transport system permease subunit
MNLLEVIADGFADIRANSGRTALQTLGVVLGVASVVATLGMMAGERAQSMKYWSETGGVLKLGVYSRPPEVVRASAREKASRGLTLDDVAAIRASIPGFDLVEPQIAGRRIIRTPRATMEYRVMGVAPRYAEYNELIVGKGRFIGDDDLGSAASVCVLGADRAQEFFGSDDVIGRDLRIGDHLFKIVGVLTYREFYWNRANDYNALGWINEIIAIPVTAVQARFSGAGSRKVDELALRLRSVEDHDESVAALKRILLARHGAEDFQVWDRLDRIQQMNQQGQVYDFTFMACGAISLIGSIIVVANILLASLAERLREVGIRKALGAKGWHIAVQYLLEGLIVTGIGAGAGLLLGIGFVHAMASLLDQMAVLTPTMVLAAVVSPVVVTLLAGSYPALRAARLDPVVALRYE